MVPGASSAVVLTFEAAATAFASVFHALARGFEGPSAGTSFAD